VGLFTEPILAFRSKGIGFFFRGLSFFKPVYSGTKAIGKEILRNMFQYN
jgi:hypothetical protein